MLKRILFLDDNPARIRWAERELPFDTTNKRVGLVTAVCNVKAAIHQLVIAKLNGDWDEVYLDHDLNGETFVDSSRKDFGMEVVRWTVANRPTIGKVIVHTMNNPAGCRMVAALQDAGYSAEYVPFLTLAKSRLECDE